MTRSDDQALRKHYRGLVVVECRSGILSEADVLGGMLDALAQEVPGDHPVVAELTRFVEETFAAHALREATWTEHGTNDAIDAAIAALARVDIGASVGLRNHENAPLSFVDLTQGKRGTVLWFRDDLMEGTAGASLGTQTSGAPIDREVVAVFASYGVQLEERDDPSFPLRIPPFEWRKRRVTKASPETAVEPAKLVEKCASCGGRGWILPRSASDFPSRCGCQR